MKETTIEVEDSKVTVGPSTKQKVVAGASQVAISLAVTVAASFVTNWLNQKVQNIILPDQES